MFEPWCKLYICICIAGVQLYYYYFWSIWVVLNWCNFWYYYYLVHPFPHNRIFFSWNWYNFSIWYMRDHFFSIMLSHFVEDILVNLWNTCMHIIVGNSKMHPIKPMKRYFQIRYIYYIQIKMNEWMDLKCKTVVARTTEYIWLKKILSLFWICVLICPKYICSHCFWQN